MKNNYENYEKITLPFYKDKFGKVLTIQDNLENIVDRLLNKKR